MKNHEYEGQLCDTAECGGTYEYPRVADCSCHISPPCEACIANLVECTVCGRCPGTDVDPDEEE